MYTVLGIFNNTQRAEECISNLETKGFNPKDISIIMCNREEGIELSHSTGANVSGSSVGGALVGGLAGLVASYVLTGLGAFLIGGPIATAIGLSGVAAITIGGAATGAVVGGISGALMGFGFSEDEANQYEQHINAGGILVAVPTMDNQYDMVHRTLESYKATNVRSLLMPQDRVQERNTRVMSDRDESYEEKPTHAESTRQYAATGTKGGHTAKATSRARHTSRRSRIQRSRTHE